MTRMRISRQVRTATVARVWFGLTGLVVGVGIVVQLFATADVENGRFAALHSRLFNVFCFFTVQSNIIVGVTCLLLALSLDRPSTAYRVLRLDGLIGIVVTFVVFHVALSSLQELSGKAAVADFLLHTASPIMCALGWVMFGPRGWVTWRVVWLSLIFPICWLAFTLLRGPIVSFYPYPFLDVDEHGYPRVLLSSLLVAVLFVGLGALARVADRWLTRAGSSNPVTAP
jgi:hypothetical protein